ncbi:MAG: HAD family hydrolase [Planctomycetes bacterium]|nr:HAD family hydrolase [Planctomycetota bacterium]
MITIVIFDLDDTLYEEIDYCKSGFAAVAEFIVNEADKKTVIPAQAEIQKSNSSVDSRSFDFAQDRLCGNDIKKIEHIFDCLWQQFSSGNHTQTFNAALKELGINYDDKFIAELIKVYRNHIPKITLPTESRDVLEKLSEKYTLAMLTDGFLPAQQLKVKALGIEKYFKCIIYTEQLGRENWKPSPAGFEKIMADLDAKAENMVYVADNEQKDFIAPNKLGFATVKLIRQSGIHKTTPIKPSDAAQYTIAQISQLPALIEKL